MKKLIKIILFELWLVVACFIIKNGAPWMMQIPLTYLIIAVFALMPFLLLLINSVFDLSTQPISRLFLIFIVFLMLITLVVIGIIMLGGEKIYESVLQALR